MLFSSGRARRALVTKLALCLPTSSARFSHFPDHPQAPPHELNSIRVNDYGTVWSWAMRELCVVPGWQGAARDLS
ncbi:hypothetical protein EDB86DRAFT_2931993 [Lactarius hatsudake]|nr:hypothetical protein EDB86DRAFT_2931993 [Lactarius hatsudake]